MADPWGSAIYATTDASGNGAFSFEVDMHMESAKGNALVLHANDGSRVACGILA